MKKLLDDKIRLLHILQSIEYIDGFMEGRIKESLYNEPMFRFAVERQLEIIGEAANHLSDALIELSSETEWRKIIAFRNFVAHEYFGIDLELLWDVATNKLPPLKRAVEQLLAGYFTE
ncbi:HepT-like ribonuclease domain-containing protein [Spirosoma luteum]|uniref:HepT-like ribonuclease domain-containing protein n=1 Tax=Spirosoma luteum TaxID=431553 RepID=UPI00036AFB5D|nr:HepT-like ribonuclease domain-containing protein [Spirosoma luteum]